MQQIATSITNETAKMPPVTSPLKWAGGKRWLVPHIAQTWYPYQHSRLIEPFVGGMAVTLGLQPARALLNDTNPHLINFYKWLKQGLTISIEMENDQALYYNHRERFNQLIRDANFQNEEAASLFYYLNRTGFNGLCRFNRSGEFNVPFGKYKTINYIRDFAKYKPILAGWDICEGDFGAIKIGSTDFIYADPPYDVPFTTYSAGGFSWGDQVRLAQWLAQHDNPVIASNQATERILDLYSSLGFDITVLNAPRMISCTGDRTPAREMLATKNIALRSIADGIP